MPTTFWGLFIFSTALSLVATFAAVGAIALVRRIRNPGEGRARIRSRERCFPPASALTDPLRALMRRANVVRRRAV
jgi:hypothetical protein